MKIVCKVSNLNILNDIVNYVDAVMLLDNDDIINNINIVEKNNLIPIYNLAFMICPFDLDLYKKKINAVINTNTLFYITDLGLAKYIKDLGYINRVIYDPITMITNSLDAKEYYSYDFNAVGLSNEITLKDIKKISNDVSSFLQVFGYRLMMNSRRKLISLYKEKINQEYENKNIIIKEDTRDEYYPVLEDDKGTKIYRSYLISLLKEFQNLNLKYAFLDNFNIDDNTYIKVLKIYKESFNNLDDSIKKLNELNLNIKEGFSYKDSIYMKEEF